MPDLTPEQLARQQIDAQLVACGWVVQDYRAVDFSAGRGIALCEVPLQVITYRAPNFHQDTGLRFEELTADTFRCPSCGQTVRDPLASEGQTGWRTA